MSSVPVPTFPWISIPSFAQIGQAHAFANREEQLAQIYKALVAAGNAVRAGQIGVRQRYVISGYKGVGKSSVILQALGMLRDETGVPEGGQVKLPPGLPDPEDRHRWLILRASGKQVASVDGIADDMRKAVLSVLDDLREEAQRKVPGALELPLMHRLLRTREASLFADVKGALQTLALMIDYVRRWEGSTQKDSLQLSGQVDSNRSAEGQLEGVLKAQGEPLKTTSAQSALKLAASYVRKWASSSKTSTTVERQLVVSADLVVQSLNSFFEATDRAGVPTILVLDDFDEFASNVGPSHHERSRVLQTIVGAFSQLRPTMLIIGLREEYLHEDILRQYKNVPVPPMTRASAVDGLSAWAQVQQPPLNPKVVADLHALGDRFLSRFEPDEPVVIPFTFFQLVAWLANNAAGSEQSDYDLLMRYVKGSFNIEVQRALQRIANAIQPDGLHSVAGLAPIEPGPYNITDRERAALVRSGLLRPAMAGDPNDTRVVLDPLFAYLRAAKPAS